MGDDGDPDRAVREFMEKLAAGLSKAVTAM
jgi:hypothetical protein